MLGESLLGEPIVPDKKGNDYQLSTNFLALRPGERFIVQNSPPASVWADWERVYKVALVPTPPVEDDVHSTHRNQAVICTELYPTVAARGIAWGWVHLEESTKEAIGYELESVGASENEWFWMVLDTRSCHAIQNELQVTADETA